MGPGRQERGPLCVQRVRLQAPTTENMQAGTGAEATRWVFGDEERERRAAPEESGTLHSREGPAS